jgi:cytochrome bd-type quinol oxidase subunit 2
LLVLAMFLGPDCEFCEPIFHMAYLWVASFILLPTVLLLVALDRLRRTQWGLALFSSALSVLLTLSTLFES